MLSTNGGCGNKTRLPEITFCNSSPAALEQLQLQGSAVKIIVRPVLGGVLRSPERFVNRSPLEQEYFIQDTRRTADFLGLSYRYPEPSPIQFQPDSLWVAEQEQPLNEYLNRLYVGAAREDKALDFLDTVGRMLWDGSTSNWHEGNHLGDALRRIDLNIESLLHETPWETAKEQLDINAQEMLDAGHWGVPLLEYNGETFYGQDRFDQLKWRIKTTN